MPQVYSELFSDGTPERLQQIFSSLENEGPGEQPCRMQPSSCSCDLRDLSWNHMQACPNTYKKRILILAFSVQAHASMYEGLLASFLHTNFCLLTALATSAADPMRRAGVVDYLSWSQRLKLKDIPLLVKHCRVAGPVTLTALSDHELQLLDNMINRLSKLAETAADVRSAYIFRDAHAAV